MTESLAVTCGTKPGGVGMRCASCSFENPDGMNFCGECAAPLTACCPNCGFENPPRFKFCGACATPCRSPPRSPPPPPASAEELLQALANRYLGVAYEGQGDYRRAIDCLGQTVVFFDGAQRRERCGEVILPAAHSRAYLAVCHAELGAFPEGRALGEEGFQIAEAVAHAASLMDAAWGGGLLCLRQGDLPGALPLLERAVGICQEADLPAFFPRIAAALGATYTLAGRVADAVPLLTQALERTIATAIVGF